MTTPTSTHDVVEQIRTVRQARLYRPDPVPADVLDRLLEVARWTGSSRNTQPWHFVVITDREQLRQVSSGAGDFQVRAPGDDARNALPEQRVVLGQHDPDPAH